MIYLFYILTGAFTGILAGLLGIGGGVILVPALLYLFTYNNLPTHNIMHMATSTSLAAVTLTTFTAMVAHHLNKAVDWPTFKHLAPGIIAGTILGSVIGSSLPSNILRGLFGVFIVLIAIHMILQKKPTAKTFRPAHTKWYLTGGVSVGALSATLGVGGGIFIVPMLLRFGLSVHQAAATSSACAFLLSFIGTISFMIIGWHNTGLPSGNIGYVYWPAAAIIALVSAIFVPFGTRLAGYLSGAVLQKVFAVFLFVVGVDMILM